MAPLLAKQTENSFQPVSLDVLHVEIVQMMMSVSLASARGLAMASMFVQILQERLLVEDAAMMKQIVNRGTVWDNMQA